MLERVEEKLEMSSQNRQAGVAGTKLVKFLSNFSLFLPPPSSVKKACLQSTLLSLSSLLACTVVSLLLVASVLQGPTGCVHIRVLLL